MFCDVKKINSFFKTADKKSIDDLMDKIILSERQKIIFEMFYLKKQNCNFIADSLCVCPGVITKELHAMREKMVRVI